MRAFHFESCLTEKDKATNCILKRVDVRVKIIALILSLLLCVSSRHIEIPTVFAVFAIVTMFWGGLSVKKILIRLSAPFSVAGLIVLIQLFLHDGKILLRLSVLKWTFVATQEGFLYGLLIAVKVLSASSLTWSFISFTPSRDILSAIQWTRVPDVILELIVMIFRYLFVLLEVGNTIKKAQSLRLGYSSYRRGLRSAAMLAGMVFIKAFEQAYQTYQAMICRGYRGRLYLKPLDRLTLNQWLQIIICFFSFGLAYVLQYSLGS